MENQEKKEQKAALWAKLIDFGLEFAVIIALPLIGFIYAGKWLDNRFGQKFFVVLGIFAALALSSYLIYRKIKDIKDLMK